MKQRTKLVAACALTLLFLLFLVLVKTVDVAAIGPNETTVGFSALNGAVRDGIGVHMGWYKLTEVLGILAILVAAAFGVLGLLQLITRKSLFKVDAQILTAGVLYLVVILLYVLFEKAIVNYRPIIMPGETEPEASFPSSHTMLTFVVMGSVTVLLKKYIQNPTLLFVLRTVCGVILVLTVIGRLVSGVHWLTDILGGVILSAALLMWFSYGLKPMKKLTKQMTKSKQKR